MKLIVALFLTLQATLTVRTVLVALPVAVTDPRGGVVAGLGQESFRLFEDGKPQPITFFHHESGPITLGLVVDHSSSMRDNLSGITAALTAFSAVVQPDDELFVVDFNEFVSRPLAALGIAFTNDARTLAAAVGASPARGRTALYDGVLSGLEQVVEGRRDKRALIVVSDGGDNASRHDYAAVQALAFRSEVVIYAIGLEGTGGERSPKVLKQLAEDSGGLAYFPKSPHAVAGALSAIVRDLRERYTLGFSPESASGAFHRIDVTAVSAGGRQLRVRTRTGYIAPEDPR